MRELNQEIKFTITWRFVFYICYISIVIFLCTNALLNYYEKWFSGIVWFMLIMSYPFSVFLIRRRNE